MYNLRRRVMVSDITSEIQNGVYAYYSNGTLRTYADADTNAIGVAVITDNSSFVINKYKTSNNESLAFGGYDKNLSGLGLVIAGDAETAVTDFAGEYNTTTIIDACEGYTDSHSYKITGAPAAEACRAAFEGQGYMGSAGEWNDVITYKSEVNAMLTKIGGNTLSSTNHWTSTLYSQGGGAWRFHLGTNVMDYTSRGRAARVRAFMKL